MKCVFAFLMVLLPFFGTAQNDRLEDPNTIAWPQVFTTFQLSDKWDGLVEYQWRRTDGFRTMQQSLLRAGVQYRANSQVSFALGYGWIETFPYGDFPLASNGTFPEHRIYEQVQLKNSFGKLGLTQRLRVEQRWLGKRAAVAERKIEDWLFSHRFRYMARLQHPIIQKEGFNLYAAAADEVFIGAGKNVGVNLLDQNRVALSLGSRLSQKVAVEAGYLNQTVIQGRRIKVADRERTIVQNNNGVTLSLFLNF